MREIWREVRSALGARGGEVALIEVASDGSAQHTRARDLLVRIGTIATTLSSAGVGPGDRVLMMLPNSTDYVATIFALAEIGAIPVFSKMEYRSLELEAIFSRIRPAALLVDAAATEVIQGYLPVTTVISWEKGSFTRLSRPTLPSTTEDLPGLSDRIASINVTYRGLGRPLGAMTPDVQYLHGARVLQEGLEAVPGEKLFFPLPMSHIFTLVGCILVPLLYGLTIVTSGSAHPRLVFRILADHRVEHMTAVPEIYHLLRRTIPKDFDRSFLRTFVSGGSVLTAEGYHDLVDTFDVEVLHGYGLTEFTPVSRNMRGQARAGTIGPVCSDLEVRIRNGEILLRSESLTEGYFNDPEATSTALRQGWFHTGDEGHFDDTHLVFDREIKATRKRNGVMVDLVEIESAVRRVAGYEGATVFFESGTVTALVSTRRDADIQTMHRHLVESLRGTIAPYKIPGRTVTTIKKEDGLNERTDTGGVRD